MHSRVVIAPARGFPDFVSATSAQYAPMDTFLLMFASNAAFLLETFVVLSVCLGALETVVLLAAYFLGMRSVRTDRRSIWMRFARWLLLSLEFALGADIIRTAIAPSWQEAGQLAVIAGIRTALGYFLEREMEAAAASDVRERA